MPKGENNRREFLRAGVGLAALSIPLGWPSWALQAAQLPKPGRADWTRFGSNLRGTRFNANETTIGPDNVQQLEVKWRFETEDGWPIQETPAAIGDTVFFGAGRYQYALESASGKLKWRFDWGAAGEWEATAWNQNPRYRGTRSSPQYHAGRLYFGTGSCAVFCLDAATGKQIWKTALMDSERAQRMSANIYHSPAVHAGKLYIAHSGGDATIFCLDAETGAIRWKFPVAQDTPPEWEFGGGSPWTSCAIDTERGILYNATGNNKAVMPNLGLYTNSLVAHDLDTGELLWYDQVHPQDAFDLDFNAHPMIFDAQAPGRIRGDVRPCVAAGNKAGMFCWNRYTGDRYWKVMLGQRCSSCGPENNATAFAYNRVFLQWASHSSVEPFHVSAALNAYNGDVEWMVPNPTRGSSPIAVANGLLYQGYLDGKIEALDAKNGKRLWEYQLPSAFRGGLAVANGALFASNGESRGYRVDPTPAPYSYALYCFSVGDR